MIAAPPGRILLAFSGGPDSTGLALLLRDRDPLLAYVDHRLRGPAESRRERAAVRRLAAALGLDLVRARVAPRGGTEAAARQARYATLHALARRHACGPVALAHSADDRAETVLFHLRRGVGLRGLSVPRRRARIAGVERVRPALDRRRSELHALADPWCPVRDASNRDTRTARARIRALDLPALAHRIGADPVPLLCELADAADSLRAVLEDAARMVASRADRDRLLAQHEALFAYVVEALRPAGPPLNRGAYDELRAFLRAGRTDRAHRTPGGESWRVERRGAVRVRAPGAGPHGDALPGAI